MELLLDQKVIEQRGPWRRVRRWWLGVHAQRGTICSGWSGLETVEEREYFTPTHVVGIPGPVRGGPQQAA